MKTVLFTLCGLAGVGVLFFSGRVSVPRVMYALRGDTYYDDLGVPLPLFQSSPSAKQSATAFAETLAKRVAEKMA
jgi:hypothetical protein